MKKRILGLLIVFVFAVTTLFSLNFTAFAAEPSTAVKANTSSTQSNYWSDWIYWCQGASKYSGMRSYGCRVVAFSKLLMETGIVTDSSFNPDKYFDWGVSNGYFRSSDTFEYGSTGVSPVKYAETLNKTLILEKVEKFASGESKTSKSQKIMSYLNQGYYVILGCSSHYTYIGRTKSLSAGEPYIFDSWTSWSYSKYSVTSYAKYSEFDYTSMLIYRTGSTPAPTPTPSDSTWYSIQDREGGLNLHSTPDYDDSSIVTVMRPGEKVQYLGQVSGTTIYKVRYWNIEGYCSKNYLDATTPPDMSPIGVLDSARASAGSIHVSGWAFDRDDYNNQIYLNVYLDSTWIGSLQANTERTDVNDAYPGVGSYHGYRGDISISPSISGSHTVSVWAINVGSGENKRLGEAQVNIPATTYTFDLNGWLDGAISSSIVYYGTADVYINGQLVADDCFDFCQEVPYGSTYEIKHIVASTSHTYNGVHSGNLTGTITGNTEVVLDFSTKYYVFDVNGWLDGKQEGSLSSYGTFDVYADGTKIADDAADFRWDYLYGVRYEITDIKAKPGYVYNGVHSGNLTGTITSNTEVVLDFSTKQIELTVYGWLDGHKNEQLGDFGTFDIYISGKRVGDDVTSFSGSFPYNTYYEINDIKANPGHIYFGVQHGYLNGDLTSDADVYLRFDTDDTKPEMSGLTVTDLTPNGYTISCTVTDDNGISVVEFGTWTEDDQSDLVWVNGSQNGNSWSAYVPVSEHNNKSGSYITHIYATDIAGNQSMLGKIITVPAPTYTVTYDANGGEGAPAAQTKNWGEALTLTGAVPIKNGFTFLGWATSQNAKVADYLSGASYTVDEDVTLYAVWEQSFDGIACGTFDDFTWELSNDHVLTVTGNGDMPAAENHTKAPWYGYKDQIQKIVFSEGITATSRNLFYQYEQVTQIQLPSTLTTVAGYSFSKFTALEEITIPDNVTLIGVGAFMDCTALKTVKLPDALQKMESSVFCRCTALDNVTIPAQLAVAGGWAVNDAWRGPFESCSSLTTMTFAEGMTTIPEVICAGIPNLKTITIPASVTAIGKNAFSNGSKIRDIYFGGSEKDWSAITVESNNARLSDAVMHYAIVPYTVSFNTNGSDDVFAPLSAFANSAYGELPTPTRENFTFDGWFTALEGGDQITEECIFTGDADQTLYAHWTENYSPTIEVLVIIPGASNAGIAVTAPEGGWKEGENTFAVACASPCVAMVSYDNGVTYQRLNATVVDRGASYTVENLTADTILTVSLAGDANSDGKLTNADVTRLQAITLKKIQPTPLQAVLLDVNKDGKLTNADKTRLRAVQLKKTTLSW